MTKLRGSVEAYHAEAVMSGVEDYHADQLEAAGRWLGGLAPQLGLAGTVERDALTAVLDDRHPAAGTRLGLADNRSLRGFDVCMSAPKSVSVLWALADRRTAARIVAAHDAAVDATIGWLEAHAARTRTGHDGVRSLAHGWVRGGGVPASHLEGAGPAAPHARAGGEQHDGGRRRSLADA